MTEAEWYDHEIPDSYSYSYCLDDDPVDDLVARFESDFGAIPGDGQSHQQDAEPDGSHRDYWICVPPHVKTAREAVARTFRMREKEYDPTQET